MATIHGSSHKALKHLREAPAALAVYWIYCSRTNAEGVAWPSIRGLAAATGWSKASVAEARAWLVQHGALTPADDYVRPMWRALADGQRAKALGLDHSEYYRVTGTLNVDGQTYPLLYFGGAHVESVDETPDTPDDAPDTDEETPDVLPGRTPTPQDAYAVGRLPGRTELSTSTQLDSISERDTSSSSSSSSAGYIFQLYHETFAQVVANPILADDLKDMAATYPEAWVRDAFKEAALSNAKSHRYAGTILARWQREGRTPTKRTAAPPPAPMPPREPTPHLYLQRPPTRKAVP